MGKILTDTLTADIAFHFIKKSRQPESDAWESSSRSERIVSQPIINHNLAPRHALSILEIFGMLADNGVNISDVLESVATEHGLI